MTDTPIRQFTCKVPATAGERFNELYDTRRADRPTLTRGSFFAEMVAALDHLDQAQDERRRLDDTNRTLELQKETLEHENDTLTHENERLVALMEGIRSQLGLDEGTPYDSLADEVRTVQQRAMAVPAEVTVEVERPLQPGQLLITLPEPHRTLLDETCRRLGATAQDVLLDMFVRYTVEQCSQWFYPFVIKGDDFRRLTGHTQETLRKWIRQTDRRK